MPQTRTVHALPFPSHLTESNSRPNNAICDAVVTLPCSLVVFLLQIRVWEILKGTYHEGAEGVLTYIVHLYVNFNFTLTCSLVFCLIFQIRVWEILKGTYRLVETMKEHKASVNCIKIKSNDKECVSASSDGACIIWDLVYVDS